MTVLPILHPCCRGEGVNSSLLQLSSLALLIIFIVACQTLPPFPPADLTQSGWRIYEGQAVWKRSRQAAEIAGELTVASRGDADYFVQFSKGPFPLLTGQIANGGWQLELPAENKRYSGRGQPPARLIILSLPRAVATGLPPKGWTWQNHENHSWRLENKARGEYLEGYLASTAPSAL